MRSAFTGVASVTGIALIKAALQQDTGGDSSTGFTAGTEGFLNREKTRTGGDDAG